MTTTFIPKRYVPHIYQELGIKLLVSPKGGGLFLRPGMGKTSIMLAAFKILKKLGLVRNMLVVAPLRVAQLTWPAEIEEWIDFNELTYTVLHGPKRLDRMREQKDVYITNFDGLDWLVPEIYNSNTPLFDVLVVDESSRMRNTESKRYKALKKVLAKFKRRYILTGSPQPRSLLNLFGQIFIVDRGATFGPYITHFRNKYFHTVPGDNYEYYPNKGADLEIYDALKERIFHLSDEDYLTLPKLFEVDIQVELSPEVRAKYRLMEREFFIQVEQGLVLAANAAVASGKLRQICNGAVYTDADGQFETVHDEKLEAFKDLISELNGEPALVVYQFESDYLRMSKEVPGIKFTGAKDPEAIKAQWDAGELQVLYIHPQSAGFGLNMQKGGFNMIWFGLTFDYELYAQTIKRLHRQGQERAVYVYRLLVKNSIEDKLIAKVLREREASQNKLFSTLRDYWEEVKTIQSAFGANSAL